MSAFLLVAICLPLVVNAMTIDQIAYEPFRRMDLNHDGHVTKAELLIYYDGHDLNLDAKVTIVEYNHHVDQLYTDPQVHSYLRRVFPGLDIDNNGVLNNADYDDMFAICDFNRNSMITVDEYKIYFRIIAT